MITVEYDNSCEMILVMDQEGIENFIQLLDNLRLHKDTHYHLMTPSFSGYELSENIWDSKHTLIHMLRLQRIEP